MRSQRAAVALVLTVFGFVADATSVVAQTTNAPVALPSPAPIPSPSTVPSSVAFPADPATRAAMLRTFQGLLLEQRRVSDETRAAMLEALTPAHRAYVASLVGQLTIARAPDAAATARRIDATLSLTERLGVIRADADRRTRERELMTRTLADLTARMSPDERAAVQQRVAQAQSDATRLTPQQRAVLVQQVEQIARIVAPGTAALATPQSAGELVLHALTPSANVFGL